jgi:hypothetical protein
LNTSKHTQHVHWSVTQLANNYDTNTRKIPSNSLSMLSSSAMVLHC